MVWRKQVPWSPNNLSWL